ncbi:MAG: hypothetical protein ABI895_26785 [Deltaproteobacteria bacterium]
MSHLASIRNRLGIQNRLGWVAGIPLLAACASDTVPLGGGALPQPLAAGSRCIDSRVLDASVLVSNQAALDALAGCEEIEGDLIIEVFADAELSPLASLRAVGGDLQIGAYPGSTREGYVDELPDLGDQFERGVEHGYLPSLAGLESLERTGNLQISHISSPSLSVFAGLRSIGSHRDASRAGRLVLDDNAGLVDFHGLENTRGINDVILTANPALEALDGLVLGQSLQHFSISDSPRLTELGLLAPLGSLNTLSLSGTGVRNLDDLQNLISVLDVSLSDNLELENVEGLSQLWIVESLSFRRNPRLARLPAFAEASALRSFVAIDNPELGAIALQLPPPPDGERVVHGRYIAIGPGVIEIAQNAKLQTISLAAGLPLAQDVAIYDNASLASIDLGTLKSLDSLSLTDNDRLTRLDLGALQTINYLMVIDNPLLSTVELERIRTFEQLVLRNAPALAPQSGP